MKAGYFHKAGVDWSGACRVRALSSLGSCFGMEEADCPVAISRSVGQRGVLVVVFQQHGVEVSLSSFIKHLWLTYQSNTIESPSHHS